MAAAFGQQGAPVRVFTNSVEIRSLPRVPFYQYDIIAQVQIDGTSPKAVDLPGRRSREVVDQMQNDYPKVFQPRAAFDGKKILYSTVQIKAQEFEVSMSRKKESKSGRFIVRVTPVAVIQPSDLQRLITPGGAHATQPNATAVNLLQIILSQAPNIKHNFALHSRSFYYDRHARDLPSGLQAWKGFFQSVRPVLGRMVVNIDTTTAAVYKPGNLLSSAMQVLRCNDARELLDRCARPEGWETLRKFFKNVAVSVTCSNKKGKIAELIREVGKYEFPKDGGVSNVQDHFRQRYGISLKVPQAFGVRIGKDAVFPAELCEVIPGQLYKRKLSPTDMTDFLKSSTMKPEERMHAIQSAASAGGILSYADSPWMREADMSVNASLLQINGRELRPPTVVYATNTLQSIRGGAWNVLGQRFQVPAKILGWAIVSFDTSRGAQNAMQHLAMTLLANLKKLGVVFFEERPCIELGNQQNVSKSLNDAANKAKNMIASKPGCPVQNPNVGLLLCILPQNAAPLRKEIKQWGDMVKGIPTQCVRQGKYEKASDQYCNNLALKINIRCGGQNSYVRSDVSALIQDTMFVGCDVSHPSPGITSRPSIAGVVTSIDREATRYHTTVSVQAPRQEIITEIAPMVQNGMVDYNSLHKVFPRTLVVFRDGVSEGEFAKLHETEIKDLKKLLEGLQKNTGHKTELVFIVVGKRHHVRFFPADRSHSDKSGNCSPGLVVDRDIVHSTYVDFYLQSHGGILGTSRPSHYVVLENTPGWNADQLQELSYTLCHVYGAATRSVSIPAPVYYADRVCARAEYQFIPGLDLADENSSNSEFKLDDWQKGFGQSKLRRGMYFI